MHLLWSSLKLQAGAACKHAADSHASRPEHYPERIAVHRLASSDFLRQISLRHTESADTFFGGFPFAREVHDHMVR